MKLSSWIEGCRDALRLSQDDFGQLWGAAKGTVGRIERGDVSEVHPSTVWSIAAATGVSYISLRRMAEEGGPTVPYPTQLQVARRQHQIAEGTDELSEAEQAALDLGRMMMSHADELYSILARDRSARHGRGVGLRMAAKPIKFADSKR